MWGINFSHPWEALQKSFYQATNNDIPDLSSHEKPSNDTVPSGDSNDVSGEALEARNENPRLQPRSSANKVTSTNTNNNRSTNSTNGNFSQEAITRDDKSQPSGQSNFLPIPFPSQQDNRSGSKSRNSSSNKNGNTQSPYNSYEQPAAVYGGNAPYTPYGFPHPYVPPPSYPDPYNLEHGPSSSYYYPYAYPKQSKTTNSPDCNPCDPCKNECDDGCDDGWPWGYFLLLFFFFAMAIWILLGDGTSASASGLVASLSSALFEAFHTW